MESVSVAKRRAMVATVIVFGALMILIAGWTNFLAVPTPFQVLGLTEEGFPLVSMTVGGLACILGGLFIWAADRQRQDPAGLHCRECGNRFEHEFCLTCGRDRPQGA